ncbi:575_t:CDS:2, partial [Entrophospora sp. SA101]
NGDVLIIDMSNSEHGLVASLLQDYFKIVNGGVIINPPIVIGIDKLFDLTVLHIQIHDTIKVPV